MKVVRSGIPDVLILEPTVYGDERGFLQESYNKRVLRDAAGIVKDFVQDNHSRSARNVLRGLHYQITQPQGKLLRVVQGAVFDVAVDMRKSSPTFGKWVGFELSAENKRVAWVPEGFAHGFLVLSESADVLYKATAYYVPESERTVAWNDPDLGIAWPLKGAPVLSDRDRRGVAFAEAETYA